MDSSEPAAAPGEPADGFKAYDEGTYGKIMYHAESDVIRKRMRLVIPPADAAATDAAATDAADDDPPPAGAEFLDYATVSELGFYGSLLARPPPVAGILPLIRYERTEDAADLYFPHGGVTLYKWLRKQTTRRRRDAAPEILYQLATTLADLYDRGIQNTDTKPANILIRDGGGAAADGRLQVSLIDYNLISFRVRSLRGVYGWTESFGTWCYCAPELLENNAPSDTSLTWTLGILLSTILIHFPYQGYSALKHSEMNSRRFWLKNFKRLATEYPAHLPLPPGYSLSFTPYTLDLYRRCTQWDPTKRPTLAAVRDELAAMLLPAAAATAPPRSMPPPASARSAPKWRPLVPRRRRNAVAQTFYDVFDQYRMEFPPHVFVAATLYLDRGTTSGAVAPYASAAFHLALLFYHQYNYDLPGLTLYHPLFADGAAVWELGDALGWNLTIPTDLLCIASYNPDLLHGFFRDQRKAYQDNDIYLKLARLGSVYRSDDDEDATSSDDDDDDDDDDDVPADTAADVPAVATPEADPTVS